jgi:quinolinate synthase
MASSFPSMRISARTITPLGAFAEAQATFLRPDAASVASLDALLAERKVGLVAHFYMDVELQGVLSALSWPLVHIADSLAMADHAVRMVAKGAERIVVLGVDFMSENVRAVLDAAGYADIPVYRLAEDAIGCSLAEAADKPAYDAWLKRAAASANPLHVIYINTSLITKARATHRVPTITATSSNVVATVLQAAAQIDDVSIWYGPDSYMGANLASMLASFATLSDAAIAELHPAHNRATIASLLQRFHTFDQGICVVHHLFGDDVSRRVAEDHSHAHLAAHLEVPGEMFELAATAQRDGRGVVGSTSNILSYIRTTTKRAAEASGPQRVEVVLGTEAGMITSIVKHVQADLLASGRNDVEVEVVFPVASEAVARAPDSPLAIVPGVAGGEGCSTAGGCATCPFMKMNDLDALFGVVESIQQPERMSAYAPRKYTELVGGRTAAELGSTSILAMRHFQRTGELPASLVEAVHTHVG